MLLLVVIVGNVGEERGLLCIGSGVGEEVG